MKSEKSSLTNLDPTVLNPSARPVGSGGMRTNVTILDTTREIASQLGNGNRSEGIDFAVGIAQEIYQKIQNQGLFNPFWNMSDYEVLEQDFGFDEESDRKIETDNLTDNFPSPDDILLAHQWEKVIEADLLRSHPLIEIPEVEEIRHRILEIEGERRDGITQMGRKFYQEKHRNGDAEKISTEELKICWRMYDGA